MNDPIIKGRKNKVTIFAIISIVLCIISISIGIYDFILEQKAINASAIVRAVEYKQGTYNVTVDYKVNNELYTKTVTMRTGNKLAVNDSINIKYSINNPNVLINNNHLIIIIPMLAISIILMIIILPKFIKQIKASNNLKMLKKKGSYLEATITEIFINNQGKKYKGQYPYRLRCKYLNPQDNQEYKFESEDTYVNITNTLNQYHTKVITVYLDKLDTTNYYVDLNTLIPKIDLVDIEAFMKPPKKEEPKEKEQKEEKKEEENAESKDKETKKDK